MTEIGGGSSRMTGLDVLQTFVVPLFFATQKVSEGLEGLEDSAPMDYCMADLVAHAVEQLVCWHPMLLKSRADSQQCGLLLAVRR